MLDRESSHPKPLHQKFVVWGRKHVWKVLFFIVFLMLYLFWPSKTVLSAQKPVCNTYAIAFFGHVRNGDLTGPFWRRYFLKDSVSPKFDVFWSGPNTIWGYSEKYPKRQNVSREYLEAIVGKGNLKDWLMYTVNDSENKEVLRRFNLNDTFPLKSPEGQIFGMQFASRTVAALNAITSVSRVVVHYAKTQCRSLYTHVLLTRLDVLPWFYHRLPITGDDTVLCNIGEGVFPSGQRHYGVAALFDSDYRVRPGTGFNDQFMWIPWRIFQRLTSLTDVAVRMWTNGSIIPNMENTMHAAYEKFGAKRIICYDMIPYILLRGDNGERQAPEQLARMWKAADSLTENKAIKTAFVRR